MQKLLPITLPSRWLSGGVLLPGEVLLCFRFGGHRVIFRELNLLRGALQLVGMVLLCSAEIMQCPQRLTCWHLSILKLPNQLRKSKLCCPPPLTRSAAMYFTLQCSDDLKAWLDHAKLACDVCWATICDSYAKANFGNQENWRQKIAEADGVLDKQVLEAALGKRRPKQLMWGLSGHITIGLSLDLGSEQCYGRRIPFCQFG